MTASSILNKNYIVSDPALTFTFNSWTHTYSYCPAFTYTATLTSPTIGSLPTIISFDATLR